MSWTPDGLVTIMGISLSLIFAYFPWVKEWFDQIDPRWKPIINILALLAVAAGKMAWDCKFSWECITLNWAQMFMVWFYAVIANQTTFVVAVKQPKRTNRPFTPMYFR